MSLPVRTWPSLIWPRERPVRTCPSLICPRPPSEVVREKAEEGRQESAATATAAARGKRRERVYMVEEGERMRGEEKRRWENGGYI